MTELPEMIETGLGRQNVVERLRAEFDRSFAQAPHAASGAPETLLAIRIRDEPLALRLQDIAGLFADRVVTRLPGPFPDLLGLASFRGTTVPVFDLGALLGYPPGAALRWLALTAGTAPVGLAFDRFERTELLGADAVGAAVAAGNDRPGGHHARQVARTTDGPRPVVDVASILRALDARVTRAR